MIAYNIMRGNPATLVKAVKPKGSQTVKAMGENLVNMAFTLPVYVDFKLNDFIVLDGEKYIINEDVQWEKSGKRKYSYSVQFQHEFYDLAKVQLKFLDPSNGYRQTKFDIMGNASTIVGLVVESINQNYSGWSVGVVDDTDYKLFSFDATNCLKALYQLVDEFKTEVWFDNKTIHLQKRVQSSGLSLAYGKGNGLLNISRQNKTDANIITRLYVSGSSQNLPTGYRDNVGNLILPGGLNYYQDNAKVALYGLIEASLNFDIKPEREGSVTAVVAGDGNWKYFTDNTLDFDVNAQLSAGLEAKVRFLTVQLAGYTFTINNYNHATKSFTINKNEDEKALDLPSNLFRPAVGDKYSLIDIVMPQSYVNDAEARLLAATLEYYNANSEPKFLVGYTASVDKLFVKQNNVNLQLGNTIVFPDAELGLNVELRIAGYTRDLENRDFYEEIEWADTLTVNEVARQSQQQQRTLQAIESSGLLNPDAIRKNIFLNRLSELNGYLMLSGQKVKAGLADFATDAAHAAIADYAWDADKWDGRQFADYLNQPVRQTDAVKFASVVADTVNSSVYVSGFTGSGYKINPDGSAEFDSLTVRKELNINVLNVREITGSGGSVAITNVAKIKEVLDNGTFYRCKINTDDGTIAVQLRANDVIRCQIWDGKKLKYYSAIVTSVGADFFDFDKSSIIGGGIPQAGDTVFQFGNTTDANRQGLLYLTNSDTGAPYLDVLDGITSDNLAGKTKVRLGKLDGINDADFGQLQGYGLYGQNAYLTNSKFKGIVEVTGGNAQTIAGSQALANTAQNNAITQATTQAAADATVKASAAQVAAIQAAANDASAKVAAIQVGGRNLVRDGSFELGLLLPSSEVSVKANIENVDIDGNPPFLGSKVFRVHKFDHLNATDNYVILNQQLTLQVGKTYTLSFYYKCAGAINGNSSYIYVDGVPNWLPVNWSFSAQWQKYEYTFGTSGSTYELRFGFASAAGQSAWFCIDAIKLEEGNKSTDWTPAIEDVSNDAQAKADVAQSAAQTYAAAQAAYEREIAKAYADGKITAEEQARIAQAAANLQTANDDAQQKVNAALASANGYTDTKALATISAAQTYADNTAQTKANAAQVNAVSQASTDAQNKANAAQSAAATLSQQLIDSLKIGGRNLIQNSKNVFLLGSDYASTSNRGNGTITFNGGLFNAFMFVDLPAGYSKTGKTLVVSVEVRINNNASNLNFSAFFNYPEYISSIDFGNQNVNAWKRIEISNTVTDTNQGNFLILLHGIGNPSTTLEYRNLKIEEGNKATDWTPSPEDVQSAIDNAKALADAANASYASLTANLKSLAYQDVVELAKLGSTIIEGGKIKTTLLDADYIRANVVNAGYINTLELDASAIKSGTIDSARINASQIISNGGGASLTFVNSAITTASSQAVADATAKASAAQVAAIQSAANDATNKANAAQQNAYNGAVSEAQIKADAAQVAATNAAYLQAAYEREVAKAYTDGKITTEEATRLSQLAANLQAAKDDAQNKVNAAIATANGYTDTKALATISAAQSYADNSAQSKANAAQANAISQASTDAQNKANAAQAAAAVLSQQFVDGIKIGGRNMLIGSADGFGWSGHHSGSEFRISTANPNESAYITSPSIQLTAGRQMVLSFEAKQTQNINSCDLFILGNYQVEGFAFYTLYDVTTDWFKHVFVFTVPNTVVSPVNTRIDHNGSNDGQPATIFVRNIKLEYGNKVTDWTPAPEDAQRAIEVAKSAADTANAAYASLTANLKSLAYADVVELAKLGSTIIEGGKIKTTLLDANYIRANIVNASYITALDIVTTKVAATQGFVGGFNIVNQSLIAGSTSDNPSAWELNSSNIRLYTDFQLFRKIGEVASLTDEMSINLGYYPASTGLTYKDTLVLKNNIPNTNYPNGGAENPFITRAKNRALVLEAKNSDENIALEVMNGYVYLRDVWGADNATSPIQGWIKFRTIGADKVLVLSPTAPPINSSVPDGQGLFWNDEQTGYATHSGCNGYDPQYGSERGSDHQYTVPAHTQSSTASKAQANSLAASEAQNQAQLLADTNGYCYYQ